MRLNDAEVGVAPVPNEALPVSWGVETSFPSTAVSPLAQVAQLLGISRRTVVNRLNAFAEGARKYQTRAAG